MQGTRLVRGSIRFADTTVRHIQVVFLVAIYHTPFLAVVDSDRHAVARINEVLHEMKRRNLLHFRALR